MRMYLRFHDRFLLLPCSTLDIVSSSPLQKLQPRNSMYYNLLNQVDSGLLNTWKQNLMLPLS